MGIVQCSATQLGSAHRPVLVGRITMGFCQVRWAVRNGANPLKGVALKPKPIDDVSNESDLGTITVRLNAVGWLVGLIKTMEDVYNC
jgi:hypothetical protein